MLKTLPGRGSLAAGLEPSGPAEGCRGSHALGLRSSGGGVQEKRA